MVLGPFDCPSICSHVLSVDMQSERKLRRCHAVRLWPVAAQHACAAVRTGRLFLELACSTVAGAGGLIQDEREHTGEDGEERSE